MCFNIETESKESAKIYINGYIVGDAFNGFNPWVWKIPWSKKWQHTPVFLTEKLQRQRSLVYVLQSMGLQRVGHN